VKVSLLNEIFYSNCAVCQTEIFSLDYLCNKCFEKEIKFVENRCNRCGYPLEVNTLFCRNCLNDNHFNKIYVLCWYSGILRKIIKNIKFNYSIKQKFIIEKIVLQNISKFDLKSYDLITPAPVHIYRRLIRFIQVSEMVGNLLSKYLKVPYSNILKKKKYTDFQWKQKRDSRFTNIRNSIVCKKDVFGLNILLVDDIITSGATINECAKVLKKGGAKNVDCFLLAKGHFR
jgi:ComF family protein